MSEKKRIRAYVNGRVQGVGYRYFAQRNARSLGLVGQVRNLGDGRVEAIAEGSEETLSQYIAILQKGPSFGHVTSVDVEWSPATGRYSDFVIAH